MNSLALIALLQLAVATGCLTNPLLVQQPQMQQQVFSGLAPVLQQSQFAPILQQQGSLVRHERASKKKKPKKQMKEKKEKIFELECLETHNKWRRLHQVGDLQFDTKIAQFSQKRADFIAESDGVEFRHPDNLPFGENLAWNSRESKSCASLIKLWYDELDLYDFDRAQFDHETGHFTQLVWKSTTRVGCARAISTGPRGGVYLVCNYDPPGNFIGEARENVFRYKEPSRMSTAVMKPVSSSTAMSTVAPTRSTTVAPTRSTTVAPTRSTTVAPISTTIAPASSSVAPAISSVAPAISSVAPTSNTNTTKRPNDKKKKKKRKKNKKNKRKNKKRPATTIKPPTSS